MAFVAIFFKFCSLAFLIVGVVGLLVPSLFKSKKTGDVPERGALFLGGVAAAFIAIIVAGAAMTVKDGGRREQASAQDKLAEVAPPPFQTTALEPAAPKKKVSKKTLGVSLEEFRKRFNTAIVDVDKNYRLAELDIKKGTVNDTFAHVIHPGFSVVGSVNKSDGSVLDLMFLVSGADTKRTIQSVIVLMAATTALNSGVSRQENSMAVIDLTASAIDNVDNGESFKRKIGALEYSASASELAGLIFAISPK